MMHDTIRNAGAGDTVAVPRRALFLRDSTSEVQLAAPGDEQPRTFSMVALTGKPLSHWYFGTLAIDLAGVRMKQRLPVLKDHNTEERLGYTTAMRNEPGRGIVAEGRLLQRSPAAQQVLADSADGFPWQASTYLQASKMQRLAEGQSDQVNGYTVEGPATIFRESTLREVTFTALGVDDDTSATPLSANGADEEVAVLLTAETMSNQTPAEQALALNPDGILLSNGPGDPAPCDYAIAAIKTFIARKIPTFGICLGHQLLGLASGATTLKMKFGHHGANHPVQDLDSKRVMITSQNHGFAIDESNLPANVRVTHRSLFDQSNQGIALTDAPAFSFQGHPEASPGPHDVAYLFDKFITLMEKR